MKNNLQIGCINSLSEIDVGMEVEVVDIKIENPLLRRRLLEMGITKGVLVKVRRIAPFGSPVSVIVRGYELGLRKDELKSIVVRLKK